MTLEELKNLFSVEELAHAFLNRCSCPFCNAESKNIKIENHDGFFMQCQNCSARGPQSDNPLHAAIVWNFRCGFPNEDNAA